MSDLISRKALMKEFSDFIKSSNNSDFARMPTWNDAVSLVGSMPPAQPEQKVGKWIRHEDEDGEPYGHNCSICGEWYVMPYGKTKFCPNCGAKMEEQDADGA